MSGRIIGIGKTEDVAGMILFLLSERAGWITRQNFFVDSVTVPNRIFKLGGGIN